MNIILAYNIVNIIPLFLSITSKNDVNKKKYSTKCDFYQFLPKTLNFIYKGKYFISDTYKKTFFFH